MRTKIIKLSQQEYDLLKQAREALIHKGLKNLPKELQDKIESSLDLKDENLTLGKMVGIVAITLDYTLRGNAK